MQNKSKSLAALVLRLLTISKYDWPLLKIVTVKYLQNQVTRISNWLKTLCQINQEILRASKTVEMLSN